MREHAKAEVSQRVVSVLVDAMFIIVICSVIFSVGYFSATGNYVSHFGEGELAGSNGVVFEVIALLIVYLVALLYMFLSYSVGSRQTMGQYFVGIRLNGVDDLGVIGKLLRISYGIMFGGIITKRDGYGMTFYDKKYLTRLVKKNYII